MTRLTRDVLRGASAALAAGALIAGVPTGLWRLVGWPLPDTVPSWDRIAAALSDSYIPDDALVNALAIVCWLAWLQIIVALAVETAATIAGRPTPALPLTRPAQLFAARLVTAIALLGTLTTPRTTAIEPAPTSTLVVQTALTATADRAHLGDPAAPELETRRTDETARVPTPTYIVQRRDDLWSIAERHLDDPYRWPEIWQRNRHRTMVDGRTFTDPDCIHAGWILDLPADATDLPTRDAGDATGRDDEQPDVETDAPPPPNEHEPPVTSPPGNEADSGVIAPPAPAGPAPTDSPTRESAATPAPTPHPSQQPTSAAAAASPSEWVDRDDAVDPADIDPLLRLPSGSVIGATLAAGIAAALAAVRLHRRRRYIPTAPAPGMSHDDPYTDATIRRVQRHHDALDGARTRDGEQAAGRPGSPLGVPVSPLAPVTIGDHDNHPVTADLTGLGGLAITGPAAADTTRALLVDFLATAPGRRRIICDRPTADHLLPAAPTMPGLEITTDLQTALTAIEVEIVARTRLLDRLDVADYPALVTDHPDDPTPAVVLVTSRPEPAVQPRIDALIGLGRRLGIGAVLHQPPADTTTTGHISTAADHTVAETAGLGLAVGDRLCTLTADDTGRFLAVLAVARDPRPPEEDPPTHDVEPAAAGWAQPEPTSGLEVSGDRLPAAAGDAFPTGAGGQSQRAVTVRLLGPPTIAVNGEAIRTGLRRKARELLAALLIHPDGLTVDAAVDILWPDADPTRGVERFRTVVGNLRSTLRDATGLHDQPIIDRVDDRYHADPRVIDCDLWRFQTALTAATATDDAAAIAALQRAAEVYGGDLVDGSYYEWADAAREDLRRRAVDAAARLAELHQSAGDLDAALAALDQAIVHDPYTEELYRRTMRLQATLGRIDAVRRTYRLLETRLADLDVEPDDTTTALLHDLLAAEHAAVAQEMRSAISVTTRHGNP